MKKHSLEFTIKKLGNRLYEVKRLVNGGWIAYSGIGEKEGALMGQATTLKEACENLLFLLEHRIAIHEEIV